MYDIVVKTPNVFHVRDKWWVWLCYTTSQVVSSSTSFFGVLRFIIFWCWCGFYTYIES
jgi:hypothetical protein